MKMMFIVLAVMIAGAAHAGDISTMPTSIYNKDGTMRSYVDSADTKAIVMAADNTGIMRIAYRMTRADMLKLRAMCDETIAAMDKRGN